MADTTPESEGYTVGDSFISVLVETFDDGRPWPRVRPVFGGPLDSKMRVEFPKALRAQYPLGARFRVDVKVAQKHHKSGSKQGQPRGGPYLVANAKTIRNVARTTTPIPATAAPLPKSLATLRSEATQSPHADEQLMAYIMARAEGQCDACGCDAPFTYRNGKPYLIVHTVDTAALLRGVAALCPNCHSRLTVGDRRDAFLASVQQRVRTMEDALERS